MFWLEPAAGDSFSLNVEKNVSIMLLRDWLESNQLLCVFFYMEFFCAKEKENSWYCIEPHNFEYRIFRAVFFVVWIYEQTLDTFLTFGWKKYPTFFNPSRKKKRRKITKRKQNICVFDTNKILCATVFSVRSRFQLNTTLQADIIRILLVFLE